MTTPKNYIKNLPLNGIKSVNTMLNFRLDLDYIVYSIYKSLN